MKKLLNLVAEEVRKCKRCPALIAMVRHQNGILTPYTFDGVNHFINCPAAAEFRRERRKDTE